MSYDFTKSVDIKAVNDDEMTATGVVMTAEELAQLRAGQRLNV